MKICFFTENYYKGGLDTFLINLFNAWPEAADELTLLCNDTHPGLATVAEKTLRTIKIKRYCRVFTSTVAQGQSTLKWSRSFPIRAFFVLSYRLLQYPILFPWYVFTLMLFFRRSDFDRLMVVNGGYPAGLLGRCAIIAWYLAGKRPLAVMSFHSSAAHPPWYYRLFEYIIDAWVIRSASHITSVSNACLSSLSNRGAFLGCVKLAYIYNGIQDPVRLPKVVSVTTKTKQLTGQYCLMLATYHKYKGHSFLFEAFKNVLELFPDVRLQIYGHGWPHDKKLVADEVKRLKLEDNVTLGDFKTQTTELLSGASVLLVPSQAYESFGLTIIEAMALGVPVVTTDVGGMPEVLGESNAGYVCSKDNPLEFADAIKNILGNPALASELGRNGRKAFESRFVAETMAMNYRKLLE